MRGVRPSTTSSHSRVEHGLGVRHSTVTQCWHDEARGLAFPSHRMPAIVHEQCQLEPRYHLLELAIAPCASKKRVRRVLWDPHHADSTKSKQRCIPKASRIGAATATAISRAT